MREPPVNDVWLLAFPESISCDDRCEGLLSDVRIDRFAGEQAEPQLGRSRDTGQHERPVTSQVTEHRRMRAKDLPFAPFDESGAQADQSMLGEQSAEPVSRVGSEPRRPLP